MLVVVALQGVLGLEDLVATENVALEDRCGLLRTLLLGLHVHFITHICFLFLVLRFRFLFALIAVHGHRDKGGLLDQSIGVSTHAT